MHRSKVSHFVSDRLYIVLDTLWNKDIDYMYIGMDTLWNKDMGYI